ncbi:hypothetical protein EBT31_20585 [bacterium]|jgi:hypothetical protein|nr:hypothetical protein [bacterium]
MKVVTVATNSQALFPYYLDACSKLGLEVVVLGWGQTWQGFAWRWDLLEQYLTTLAPDEIVVWTDAYDVLPVAGPETVQSRFFDFRKDIVFSVEEMKNPWKTYFRERMFGNCRSFAHVNGGLYMGYCGALLEMIAHLKAFGIGPADDDQRLLNTVLCSTDFVSSRCGFDHESRLFHNLANERLAPDIDTCFIHGPGNVNMQRVAEQYGYHVGNTKRNSLLYRINFMKHHAPNLYREYLASVCLFLVSVIILLKLLKLRRK